MNHKDYWYAEGDETRGPVKFGELQALYRRGGIHEQTLIWFEETPDWKPLSQLEGLWVQLRTTPPPLPPRADAAPAAPAPGPSKPPAVVEPWAEPRLPEMPSATPAATEAVAAAVMDGPHEPGSTSFSLDEAKLAKGLVDATPAGAWQRLVARGADSCILGTPVFVFFGLMWPELFAADDSEMLSMVLALPLMLLLEAVCIGLFGNSPGKALVGLRARRADGTLLDFGSAVGRLLRVWVTGLFFGIPLFGNLAALYQGIRVAGDRPTTYDEGRYFVSNRKARWWRTSIVFTFVLLFNVFMILLGVALGR